jgi:all-trans-retinol 13,14-reductase
MKLFSSYKQSPVIDAHYDAIFIGTGLGCLTAAHFLAKAGKKVLLLEKHYTPGGFTHSFKRNDYEWDVGVHYIGEMSRKNSIMYRIFDHISEGKLEWADMGEVYDNIVIQDRVYPFRKGTKQFVEDLKMRFPDPQDQKAIDQYMDAVFQCTRSAGTFFAEKALPSLVSMFSGPFMRSGFLKYAKKTTLEVIQEFTSNKELIAVLTGQYGDYGMPPGSSSFGIHATVARHYLAGGAYPVGGAGAMFDTISPSIVKAGGQILISAAVEQILIKSGKAYGVRMADGREIHSDIVISGAGAHNTFLQLIPGDVLLKMPFRKQLTQLKASYGHISLYIGFKESSDVLKLPKANFWYYQQGNDHDAAVKHYLEDPINNPFPVIYMSFPSAKDPSFERRYPGRSTVELISMIPYDIFAKWEGSRWHKRGEDYEALKEHLSQKLMKGLFELLPHLEGKIDHYELSTPLTTKHFANYRHGEIYGLDHGPDRFEQKFLKPATPIDNLFLTGQDIVSVGIGGALMSGVLTASAVLKKNLINDVLKKEG